MKPARKAPPGAKKVAQLFGIVCLVWFDKMGLIVKISRRRVAWTDEEGIPDGPDALHGAYYFALKRGAPSDAVRGIAFDSRDAFDDRAVCTGLHTDKEHPLPATGWAR